MAQKKKDRLNGLRRGVALLMGLISIDMVKHSNVKGSEKDLSLTRSSFLTMVEAQLPDKDTWKLLRQGDGEAFLFDISRGCDEMILFADRVNQLVPYFNRTKGLLNKLPNERQLSARIVCHVGEIVNLEGSSGDLGGEAISLLLKHERKIGKPGKVVLTQDVFRLLSEPIKARCMSSGVNDRFGQFYVLNGVRTTADIQLNDRQSSQLRDWVKTMLSQRKYKSLLYFGYTNERLHNFISYELSGIDAKILVRNWVVERLSEQKHNRSIKRGRGGDKTAPRPWFKADMIKATAKAYMENETWKKSRNNLETRFYDAPPYFSGVILLNDDLRSASAQIGFFKWVENPEGGGSPYKLEEWPGIILDGSVPEHLMLLDNILSRFRELWDNSHTYEQVCDQEVTEEVKDPSVVGQVWSVDGTPYKIVYPLRNEPHKSFPMVSHEDVKAFRAIEGFLKYYGIDSEIYNITINHDHKGKWITKKDEQELEKWNGHIVYICAKSIPPSIQVYMRKIGVQMEFRDIGTSKPFVVDVETKSKWYSPLDEARPEPKDYCLIARFRRPKKNTYAYVIAGTHGIGTCGGAIYLTDKINLNILVQITGGKDFVALVTSKFDAATRDIDAPDLLIAPRLIG